MKTISAFNKKGGIGKTSSVISIGSELACLGYRVLLIDIILMEMQILMS